MGWYKISITNAITRTWVVTGEDENEAMEAIDAAEPKHIREEGLGLDSEVDGPYHTEAEAL